MGRTAKVRSDGSYTISSVPATLGMFRVRLVGTNSQLAQSDCVMPVLFGTTLIPGLDFFNIIPIPTGLALASNVNMFSSVGETGQVTVTGLYQSGAAGNLTADTCTTYMSSNPTVLAVSATGQLLVKRTAITATPVTITALNEGAVGTVTVTVKSNSGPLRYAESFENGLPQGWTLAGRGGTNSSVTNLAPTDGGKFGYIDTQGSVSTAKYGGTAGSTLLSAPIALDDGSVLSMDLNFLTNDGGGFHDFAFVQLLDSATLNVVATLYSANTTSNIAQAVPAQGAPAPLISPNATLVPGGAFFDGISTGPLNGLSYGPNKFAGGPGGSTGWVNTSYKVMAGTYRLFFVVSCFQDTNVKSGLAIDNIQATIPK